MLIMAQNNSGGKEIDYGMEYDPAPFMAKMAKERAMEAAVAVAEEANVCDGNVLVKRKQVARKTTLDAKGLDSDSEDDSVMEKVKKQWTEMLKKEAAEKVEAQDITKECMYCSMSPCVMKSGLYEELMFVGEGMEEAGSTNKEIRFELYCLSAKRLYGKLGSGNRKKLPSCLMSEIHDAYPAERGAPYVGFMEAFGARAELSIVSPPVDRNNKRNNNRKQPPPMLPLEEQPLPMHVVKAKASKKEENKDAMKPMMN
jgi:hypothetical protein